ncbi:unnamed protein product [Effrenium voratum]|nr:unnamed protein product [Effrenium voratum]
MVKKKIDPVDGCAYSLAELEAHYARTYKKKDIQKYWETDCTPAPSEASPKVKAKAKAKGEASKPAAKEGEGEAKTKGEEKQAAPVLRRTRSWLKKVCGIALLPCEESSWRRCWSSTRPRRRPRTSPERRRCSWSCCERTPS